MTIGRRHRSSSPLKLNLLENALDFVRSGVERYFPSDVPDPQAHKYAILHLFSGALLLLKERLKREHPALIFTNVDKAGRANASTITFDQAIARLQSCTEVALEPRWVEVLRRSQKLRNELEHYEVHLELREAKERISELTEFIFHITFDAWRRMEELHEVAEEIERRRREEWNRRAAQYLRLSSDELQQFADQTEYHPKHNPDGTGLYWCDECGNETCAHVEPDMLLCTNPECGEVTRVPECLRCGEFVPTGETMCDYCAHVAQKSLDD